MRSIALVLLGFAIALTGCKKGMETQFVTGTVTLDGSPLAGANVVFEPVDPAVGFTAGGKTDENGRYKLTSLYGEGEGGAVEAEYVVLVTKSEVVALPKPIRYEDGDVATTTSKPILAATYRDKDKSPLRFRVEKGKNTIDLELKSKP